MKINWKLRLKNKATLTALIAGIVGFIYKLIGIFNIIPITTENDILDLAEIAIGVLVLLGIVVDPTTHGLNDSDTAMTYNNPRKES